MDEAFWMDAAAGREYLGRVVKHLETLAGTEFNSPGDALLWLRKLERASLVIFEKGSVTAWEGE